VTHKLRNYLHADMSKIAFWDPQVIVDHERSGRYMFVCVWGGGGGEGVKAHQTPVELDSDEELLFKAHC